MTSFQPVWKSDKTLFENQGLPDSMRLLIVGQSNCGKSFLLLRLLLEGHLDYTNLYLYTPSLHQMEYQILIESLKNGLDKEQIMAVFQSQDSIQNPIELIKEIGERITDPVDIKVEAYDNDANLPETKTFDKKKKNLLVLDDCAYDKQSNIHRYFTRGRHSNINCVYLSQSYFELPRRSIRNNSNCFIFFKLDPRDVANVWQDKASIDFPNIEDFKKLCNEAWKEKHGYLFIDITETELDKRYRMNCF
jgi:hypothetical protein